MKAEGISHQSEVAVITTNAKVTIPASAAAKGIVPA